MRCFYSKNLVFIYACLVPYGIASKELPIAIDTDYELFHSVDYAITL